MYRKNITDSIIEALADTPVILVNGGSLPLVGRTPINRGSVSLGRPALVASGLSEWSLVAPSSDTPPQFTYSTQKPVLE